MEAGAENDHLRAFCKATVRLNVLCWYASLGRPMAAISRHSGRLAGRVPTRSGHTLVRWVAPSQEITSTKTDKREQRLTSGYGRPFFSVPAAFADA